MKNDHLVPAPVHDIIEQLERPSVQENEKLALIQRLETIRDFCVKALNRAQKPPSSVFIPTRKRYSIDKKRF